MEDGENDSSKLSARGTATSEVRVDRLTEHDNESNGPILYGNTASVPLSNPIPVSAHPRVLLEVGPSQSHETKTHPLSDLHQFNMTWNLQQELNHTQPRQVAIHPFSVHTSEEATKYELEKW